MKLSLIDYRNAKYQGLVKQHQPEGVGIAISDSFSFIASCWKDGQLDGRTMVYYAHAKYTYGEWREGKPEGLNVTRLGDTVVFARYQRGTVLGRFLVIFEDQNLAMLVQLNQGRLEILERTNNKGSAFGKDMIEGLIEKAQFSQSMGGEFYNLLDFLKVSFAAEETRLSLKLESDNGNNYFGFKSGLGIVFDNDNFIKVLGDLNEKLQPSTVGSRFTPTLSEQGNFEIGEVVKYTPREKRPAEHLKQIFLKGQVRSFQYLNGFLLLNANKPLEDMQNLLRSKLMALVAQQQLEDSPGAVAADINDSLDYHPRSKHDGEKLQQIRDSLYRSIRRPGADLIASPKKPNYKPSAEVITEHSPYHLSQKENLHRHTTSTYMHPPLEPSPAIAIDRKEIILENRLHDYRTGSPNDQIFEGQIRYDNIQERRQRLLNDYRNLRTDNYHITAGKSPFKRAAHGGRQESPGRKLNMLDTDRQILNAISSSRQMVPVLHEQPNKNTPLKSHSPQKKTPNRASYMEIYERQQHLATVSTPIRESIAINGPPPRKPEIDQSPSTAAVKDGQRGKSTTKRYNYLDGMGI